jgi:hypothetical protein
VREYKGKGTSWKSIKIKLSSKHKLLILLSSLGDTGDDTWKPAITTYLTSLLPSAKIVGDT